MFDDFCKKIIARIWQGDFKLCLREKIWKSFSRASRQLVIRTKAFSVLIGVHKFCGKNNYIFHYHFQFFMTSKLQMIMKIKLNRFFTCINA